MESWVERGEGSFVQPNIFLLMPCIITGTYLNTILYFKFGRKAQFLMAGAQR